MNDSSYLLTLKVSEGIRSTKNVILSVICILYLASIIVSITLMVLISVDTALHNPMFIFLFSLICNGLIGSTAVWPSVMGHLATGINTISVEACLTQSFFIAIYVVCTYSILTIMAYDRYLCIFQPLHYHTVMSPQKVKWLLFVANILPMVLSFGQIYLASEMPLCQDVIYGLSCDPMSVSDLGCSQSELKRIDDVYTVCYFSFVVLLVLLILLSYFRIFALSSRLSPDGRRKALTTCMPHIIIFLTFSLSTSAFLIFVLITDHGSNLPVEVILLLDCLYILIPPLTNPIIYGIKKQEIRQSFSKYLKSVFAVYLSSN